MRYRGKKPKKKKDPFRDYVVFLEKENNGDNNRIKWKCNFCNNEYRGSLTRIKAHLAGVVEYWISECKAVDGRVKSEARKALKGKGAAESSKGSEGNVEEGPHQPVTADYEDARRETSSADIPSHVEYLTHPTFSRLLSFWGATSSDFLSLPETNLPDQSLHAQITIPRTDASCRTQPSQSHAGDSYIQPSNFRNPTSSQDLDSEALANMPPPVNAEVGEPNPEVPPDARTCDAPVNSRPSTCGLVDENMPILKRKLEELSSREADVDELEAWCERAKRIKGECQGMVQALQEGRSLASQQQIKRVDDLNKEIEDILGHCSFRKGLTTHLAGCSKGLPLVTTELVGDESEGTINDICNYLMNDEISIIGVYGMGGVGKTSILMHVHNRVLQNPAFNDVFWVSVPQEFKVYELQDDIANAVRLKNLSEDKDVKRRACILNEHLKKKKKAVFILDGLWMHFHIEDVGIPVEKGGIKLVLTTRSLDVCHKMLCQKQIKIKPLISVDDWRLFLRTFGKNLPSEIEKIARSIVHKCQGLPLGIIELATRMRGVERVHGWKDILRKFRDLRIKLHVFERLELSYVKLGDSQVQQCFLHLMLCFGFQEDPPYEIEVIESLIDEDLLGGLGTRQELHDQGKVVLDELRNNCLWKTREAEYTIVHPLVRDMAFHMVDSTTHMVKAHMRLKEIPEEKFWTSSLEKVYLQGNDIEDIPDGISPNCPKLTRLSLNHNVTLKGIHESFFRHLNRLKVVDLSYTRITKLPGAISDLEGLEALLLRGCEELCHIPCIRKLGSLKKLDLRGCSSLEEMPEGMEALVKLRYLDLQGPAIEALPERVLGKMVNLQYVVINYVLDEEQQEGWTDVEGLYCSTRNIETYNAYVSFLEQHSFQRYLLGLIVPSYYLCKDYRGRSIIIESCHRITARGDVEIGGDGCALIPENVQQLKVRGCGGMTSLCEVGPLGELEDLNIKEWGKLEELGAVCFPYLGKLKITRCSRVKHLWAKWQILSSLRVLHIKGLEELERIEIAAPHCPNLRNIKIRNCEKLEAMIVGSFSSGATSILQTLDISGCHNIEGVLLTHDVWPHLPSLQIIDVEDCEGIEVIIGAAAAPNTTPSSSSSSSCSFPKLKDLRLVNLPELKSICDGTLSCDSIESIDIVGCPKLKRIPLQLPSLDNGTPSPPHSLQSIWIDPQTWESLEWDDPRLRSSLQHLVKFQSDDSD